MPSPFPCSPVIREWLGKETQTEKIKYQHVKYLYPWQTESAYLHNLEITFGLSVKGMALNCSFDQAMTQFWFLCCYRKPLCVLLWATEKWT